MSYYMMNIEYTGVNITYTYINFQQNRANRSVITVHTNVFAKKSQVA